MAFQRIDRDDAKYVHIIRVGGGMDDKWREAGPVNDIEASSWIRIFRAFDTDHDGLIQCEDMQKKVRESTYSFGFDHYELQKMSLYLEMREGKPIDFTDFCYLMSKCKGYKMRELLFHSASSVTPKNQRISVFSALQKYKCVPPPLFMLFISIIQLVIYIYYVVDSHEGVWFGGPIPTLSPLILSPHHIGEPWRYLTYCLVQVGIFHTIFNIGIQIFIGVPLELVYKWRIYILYIAGVFSGTLLSLTLDPGVFLIGGSAGSFCILTSHLLTLVLNWKTMESGVPRAILWLFVGTIDLVIAVIHRFFTDRVDKVSIYGHIGGIVAGVLFTFILMRGSKSSRFDTVAFWVSLVIVVFYVTVCVALILAPNLYH
ncbi:unnamed protein product [Caenorhabditis bovis]|uniref:EF-hand domain-containing protein n=1 Tax=Caenorhabditis bovis TaxID=2654633 RepID=A0A8S1ET98_9PELO|nr:unnamed protein product [Caenorhabditis bovis]